MTERIALYHEDCFEGVRRIADASVDLAIVDPPYGLGKDYGNDSDLIAANEYLDFSKRWIEALLPKLNADASL